MSTPARNHLKSSFTVPARAQQGVPTRVMAIPARHPSLVQRALQPPLRQGISIKRDVPPMITKRRPNANQSAFPFAMPLPPELPAAMTLLLPATTVTHDEATIEVKGRKKQLVLLLPAHNEELIIAETIRSAVAAGQSKRDIYVVNDNSSDKTEEIAVKLLGKDNVLTVERSGKALAVKKAIDAFDLERRYTWLHIADADSIFSQDYFRHYRKKLDPKKYAVAVGFVQSLRGNWISTYRALTYTYSQQVTRRVQSHLGMISVFPGPITCFRTDIIKDLEFGGASLTEDFDITLQVHRKKLGKIVYIPKAVNFTQDPQTLADFCKQNMRWQRGFFQGVKKYGIGLHGQRIDASLGFQMLQTLVFLLLVFVWFPYVIAVTGNWFIIPVAIAADIIMNGFIALFASAVAKRWMLIGALPYFYFLRWIEIGIYVTAFVEVMILKRFQDEVIGWSTAGRRYQLSKQALIDVAK
jgi:cellulose synthase/poly-beta-1,6-N-acetylglucosamine synthase-like glycosyltransferase